MASDFIGRINNRQEIQGSPETALPNAPVVHGDPALNRLQRTQEAGSRQVKRSDAAHVSSEAHSANMSETQQSRSKPRSWKAPRVTRALALGGMLVGCATGAFALGGVGMFLAMAAEAMAFAGGLLSAKAKIAELEEENRLLREKAETDPLIGIFNRGAIDEILREQLLKAPFRQAAVSVILADVDHFKKVNDNYGPPVGDEGLIEVAERVYEGIRAEDEVGRYGGEEFLMVLPGICGSQAVLIAHRIRLLIAEDPFETEAGDLDITMSLGVSFTQFPEIVGAENLVKAADDALYQAKDQGRNRVVMHQLDQSTLPPQN